MILQDDKIVIFHILLLGSVQSPLTTCNYS
jgi:hypothetical protein